MVIINKIPKLRFKEFSGDWESKRLGDITKLTDGVHFTPTYVDYGIPFWSVETVASNTNPKYITKEAHNEAIKRCNPQINDILLTRIGTLAKPKLIDWEEEFSIYVSLALIKASNNYNSKFAKYYFETNYYQRDFLSKSLLTATPMKINMEDLKQTKIKLPSLKEQEKIASFLSLVDEKINLQNKKLENLKNYKKGIMQKIFNRELRFKDDNGNDYPNWEEKKLEEICILKRGEQLNRDTLIEEGEYYVLNGGIEPSGYTNKYNTNENTISISEGGNSCGYVNYNFKRFWSGGHCYTLENILNKINVKYLYQYLKYKQQNIMNLRVGTGLPNIQKKDLIIFKIKIPCLEEQNKISSFLSLIDEKIEKEQDKLNLLNTYKKGLLQQMFI